MSFTSYSFIFIFLPASLIFYQKLNNNKKKSIYFAISISLIFYIANDAQNILVLILSITANWLFAKYMMGKKYHENKIILFISIISNIFLLSFFKIPHTWHFSETANSLLPLGISYYTFTQISYLIDVAKGNAHATNAAEYTLFVAWFPHLPAGPLLSHKEMLPQFLQVSAQEPLMHRCAVGLTLFSMGLFKKVCLSYPFNSIQGDFFARAASGSPISTLEAWMACMAFLFEAYLDFSGYSEMAMGISRMFGIHLPVNFHAPFRSTSPAEFWTRWHITLGRFIHDNIYRPLTKSRKIWRHYLALMLAMIFVAMWHRVTLPMLAFGLFQGFLIICNNAFRRSSIVSRRGGFIQQWLGRLFTLVVITFSVCMWAAPDMETSIHIMVTMLGVNSIEIRQPELHHVLSLMISIFIFWFCPSMMDLIAKELPDWSFQKKNIRPTSTQWSLSAPWIILISFTLSISILNLSLASDFKYAAF
ncbi:MBOAT family protein [Comamonas sp. GB3 AK4-5]|uniref:MBOAT family O-acyltransferase n=1 Tax=Comamonas sp. GB3 AK4-5 TaxID=3231487 RepID=UPI00351DE152